MFSLVFFFFFYTVEGIGLEFIHYLWLYRFLAVDVMGFLYFEAHFTQSILSWKIFLLRTIFHVNRLCKDYMYVTIYLDSRQHGYIYIILHNMFKLVYRRLTQKLSSWFMEQLRGRSDVLKWIYWSTGATVKISHVYC